MASTSSIKIQPHTLNEAIEGISDTALQSIIRCLSTSISDISSLCRTGDTSLTKEICTSNAFGDKQLKVDVTADKIIFEALSSTGHVHIASSEEKPTENILSNDGEYCVAFDPLDGSSIIGCNWSVGTIIGIWKGSHLLGSNGENMVASITSVYGPRTTMYIACGKDWGKIVYEFTLIENDQSVDKLEWICSRSIKELKEGKLFAPANLRATQDNEGYNKLIEYFMKKRFTLRYTGGMVPDVTQIFVKGYGIYISPISISAPAKLRLLYEVMPMSYLMEHAGGKSSDGQGSILARRIKEYEERTAVYLGNREQVKTCENYCHNQQY